MTSPAPRPETIDRLGLAVFPSIAMVTGMELDVFTPLKEGPMTYEQIAQELAVSPDKLRPLLYALVAGGLLRLESDCRFANTPEAAHFLVRGNPGYLGGRYQYYRDRWSDALHAAESIRAGKPQAKRDFSALSPEELERLFRGLHPAALQSGKNLVARFDFSANRNLLDVGGGSGGLAIALTEVCPHLQASVVELPTVAPVTERFVKDAGAEDRVRVLTADVLAAPLPGSYDVATLSSFIQVLSPDEARRALWNVSKVLEPGGMIYILGQVLDNSRLSPPETVVFNLVFISVFDDGQAYTEEEHTQWLSEAGFEGFERIVNPNGTSIIRATKPG